MEELKNYYKDCKLWLPKYPNFRIWKAKLQDGTMLKIKDTIRTEKDLRKWLVKLTPKDMYYSSGCFLAPSQVRGKNKPHRMLFKNIVFDLDAEEPYTLDNIDLVRVSTILLIEDIERKLGIKPLYILFTGKKGFHVVYEFNSFDYAEFMQTKYIGIDMEITRDNFRVIKLPLTVSNSGRVSCFLTLKELKEGMNYIINKSKVIYSPQVSNVDRVGKPNKLMTDSPCKSYKTDVESHSNRPVFHSQEMAIYITNEIKNTKSYITILKYPEGSHFIGELKRLSAKYNLNQWYCFSVDKEVLCINIVALDKRRLQKILNSSSSLSNEEFKKFNKIFMRVSTVNGIKSTAPVFSNLIEFGDTNKKFQYSCPHIDLLKHFDIEVKCDRCIGALKPKTYIVSKR